MRIHLARVLSLALAGTALVAVPTAASADACAPTTIEAVQGTGDASPLAGQSVEVTGIVTGTSRDEFWIQEVPDVDDPDASNGLFVDDFRSAVETPDLSAGDVVTVCGTVGEFRGLTNLAFVSSISVGAPTTPLAPTPLTLPAPRDLESYESMFVSMDQTLHAADIYNALAFGEAFFSGTPLTIPTELFAPGSPDAAALAIENSRNAVKITLGNRLYDDLMADAGRYLRYGDTIDLGYREGHLTETFNAKQFRIMGFPFFVQASDVTLVNDRPAGDPVVSGQADTVVASFNVFNYWTSDYDFNSEYRACVRSVAGGTGFGDAAEAEAFEECGPEPRGHRNATQKANQRTMLVDAITALGADVVALQELETPGQGERNADDDPNETLIDLVGELNAAEGAGTWAYVPVPQSFIETNTNAIMSGFIYKPARVESTGDMLYLGDLADVYDRLPVAATFRRDGAKFTVVNNHWKSKGCSDATGLDTDQGDGQACYNETRTTQAEAVVDWIEDDLVKHGRTKRVLVLGDLNAYAMEDPVSVLRGAGLVDLVDGYEAPGTFSYVFFGQAGSLDHAFATKQMDAKVKSVDVWDINAAESNGLSYFGDEPSLERWRSSDHDPIVIGLDLLD